MKTCARIVALLSLVAFGCTTAPQPPAESGGGKSPATAPAQDGPYDPANDPLVNPASLFEPAPMEPGQIEENEILYRNIDGNPSTLNPIFQSSTYEGYFSDALFAGLFSFDAQMNWTVNHDVVESVEQSPDQLTYVVKMRDGMTWQDGVPFEADDVCFSWEVILDEKVPVIAARSGTDQVTNCEVLDRLTLRLTNKEPLPTNKWNVLFPIVPKHLYEKERAAHPDLNSGDYYNKLNRAPVGNGKYKFVEWVENDKIIVERWDGYWGKKPHFKRMVFRIIPDPNILLLTFNKGDIDEFRFTSKQFATQAGPGSDFDKAGGAKILKPQWDLTYIGWNQDGSNPFFTDVRVRRAMTMACDIQRMRRDLTYNLYEQATGIWHPTSWMYPKNAPAVLPFDLDAAAKLLDEAGWTADAAQEGWRYKTVDGKPTRFEFTILIPQGSALGQQIAAIMQDDLKSIGVKMEIQVLEWATFQERTRKHEFQASTAAWGTGTDPDTSWNIWHSSSYDPKGDAGRNYGGFKNARVDELFEAGRREFDQAKRAEIYAEIHSIIYEEQPYTFLFTRPILWGIHERIHGVTSSPRGVFSFDPSVDAWWVRPSEAKHATASVP